MNLINYNKMNQTNEPKKTKFKDAKKLVDKNLMNQTIEDKVQTMINKPQDDPTGIDEKDNEFLENVMNLINEETINLYMAETIMNKEVYNNASEEAQALADVNAIPLLGELRQIKLLYETGNTKTFQIKNLVHRVRLTKERLEEKCGDVYII